MPCLEAGQCISTDKDADAGEEKYIEVRLRPRDQGETERWAVTFSRDMVRDRRRSQEQSRANPISVSTDDLSVLRRCDRSAVTLAEVHGCSCEAKYVVVLEVVKERVT